MKSPKYLEPLATLIRLLPCDCQSSAVGTGFQFVAGAPFIDIRSKLSNVSLFNRFRMGVIIRFIAEKTLSASVDVAGSTRILAVTSETLRKAAAIAGRF